MTNAVGNSAIGGGAIGNRSSGQTGETSLDEFGRHAAAILDNLQRVINGKPEIAALSLVVLLAEGHLLVEDVPGVGKTTLAKALARSVGCSVSRIQFTPDLLPSDVTGVSIYNQHSREFEFKPGAVFANIVIADEINRASPKTQSALLECMEERQVSIDGQTYFLDAPFSVVATQNPIEMEGTYALPEAQRDRFMVRVSMGYPDARAELAMLQNREQKSPLDEIDAVVSRDELRGMIETARTVFVSPAVEQYAVNIAQATRRDPEIRLGVSPRATLHLVRAAKVTAALDGREFVLPDDIDALVIPVFAHRVLLTRRSLADSRPGARPSAGYAGAGLAATAGSTSRPVDEVLRRIVANTPVPLVAARKG
ncbi:AAA family ATPase [Subtercola sp. RTI3]|uniref:AAA family ATPase n=1 Tax=Subtercola sp. RTI3 TaxID=3048639 RepID=UPI002B2266E8|nr:AAA family ATPase [Subtercola sp. RTI3]MEA9985562.1 AAA family ATPase [Subtercola sp. RTI3]